MLSKLPKSSENLSKLPPVATRTPGMAQERARSHICYYPHTPCGGPALDYFDGRLAGSRG